MLPRAISLKDRKPIQPMWSGDSCRQVHIQYAENSKEFYEVSLAEGNLLTMTSAANKEWTDYIGVSAGGEDGKITVQVPDGLCAVSVPAKAVSAVGGSVRVGDKVNVYSTSAKSTDLLVANVEVLATSASTGAKKDETSDVSWITLAAKPSEVNELIAAAGVSDLYFTLPSEKFVASDMRSSAKAQGGEMAADSENAIEGNEDGSGTSASKKMGAALSESSLSTESSTGEANGEEASGVEESSKDRVDGKKEA